MTQMTIKHILSNVQVGRRSELLKTEGGKLNEERIKDAGGVLKNSFQTCLQTCSSIGEVFQLEQSFLLAIKSVQESLNHKGQSYFHDESYYSSGEIKYTPVDAKGQEFLEHFLNNNLEQLKLTCCHKEVFGPDQDRKMCFGFLSDTCYTDAAIDVRKDIRTLAREKASDLSTTNSVNMVKPLRNTLTRDAERALFSGLRGFAMQVLIGEYWGAKTGVVEAGHLQIEKINDTQARVTIFDTKPAQVQHHPAGWPYTAHPDNFHIELTHDQLRLLQAGYVDAGLTVTKFESRSWLGGQPPF